MKIFFASAILIWMIILYPHCRIIFKRLLLKNKITSLCRRKGYRLIPTHSFPFLGQNNDKSFDFYIETPTHLMRVKLFAAKHKHAVLKLHDQNRLYSFTNGLWLFGRWGTTIHMPFDTKLRALPDTDSFDVYLPDAEQKKQTHILLIYPKCFEIHGVCEDGTKRPLAVGDTVRGMRLESGKTFLEYLNH